MSDSPDDTPQDTPDSGPEETPAPSLTESLAERAGMALYGHARGLTGQSLTRAWGTIPRGLQRPYIERAEVVLNTLD